jgi:hypothetical protein
MQYGVSGNKMKNGQLFLWSELKQLFTYSPIHFLEMKSKKVDNLFLLRVKATIHLFTHSPIHLFAYSPIHLFTYSPIHLFTYSPIHSHLSIRHFRRIEPKGCRRVYGRQNWAAGILVDTVLPHL